MDPNNYPTTKQQRTEAFEEWMRKVCNEFVPNNELMTAAYERIE